jgi:hypothetical protein
VKAVMSKQAEHQDNVTVLALAPHRSAPAVMPLAPTVRIPVAAAPTSRSLKLPVAGGLLLTALLAAGVWFYYSCCQMPPLPPMPRPPGVPAEKGTK